MLEFGVDAHSSLQVEPHSMFDLRGLQFDLHHRDQVKPLEWLISFRFKLSCIRRTLPNLIDDHVKLRRDRIVLADKPGLQSLNHSWIGSVQEAVATWSAISMRYF